MRKLALFTMIYLLYFSPLAIADGVVSSALDPSSGEAGDTFTLEISVQANRSQIGTPEFDDSDKFEITQVGTSTEIEIINGRKSARVVFTYELFAKPSLEPGTYESPSGRISVSGVHQNIPTKPIIIADPKEKRTSSPANTASSPKRGGEVGFVQVVDQQNPYVGEQITYLAEVAAGETLVGGNLDDIQPAGFWRESLGEYGKDQRRIGNIIVRSYKEVLIPTKAGRLLIPARRLVAELQGPKRNPLRMRRRSDPFGHMFPDWSVFGSRQTITRTFIADKIALTVKPLPPHENAPATYTPVGDLEVHSGIASNSVALGDSINLTITLGGTANLRPFELKSVPMESGENFKIYIDSPTTEMSLDQDKIVFGKKYIVALVPKKPGKLKIPRFKIVSFDPKKESYVEQLTLDAEVEVTGNRKEQLEVVGNIPQDATQPTILENKEEVVTIGEDIAPQRKDSIYLKKIFRLSKTTTSFIAILLAVLSVLGRYLSKKRSNELKDPLATLEKNAATRANRRLAHLSEQTNTSSGAVVEEVRDAFRTYLSDRFRVKTDSLTSREIAQLIKEKLGDEHLSHKVGSHLDACQTILYSKTTPDSDLKDLQAKTKELVESIENAVSLS